MANAPPEKEKGIVDSVIGKAKKSKSSKVILAGVLIAGALLISVVALTVSAIAIVRSDNNSLKQVNLFDGCIRREEASCRVFTGGQGYWYTCSTESRSTDIRVSKHCSETCTKDFI